jgi:hypothetical protein
MTHFSKIDLPKIPDRFIKEIIYMVDNWLRGDKKVDSLYYWYCLEEKYKNTFLGEVGAEGVANSLEKNNRTSKDIAILEDYPFKYPKNFQNWINENIMPNSEARVFFMSRGKFILPHTDVRIGTTYNYIIRKGGDNVKNVFYKVKKEYENLKIYPIAYCPYEKIEIDGELDINENEWYQFDSEKIHSVENIDPTDARIIVTVNDNWFPRPATGNDYKTD